MGYLGKIPATQGKDAGPALKLDDISGDFDGLTTVFDLTVNGTAVDPHVNNISIYLSGVYQIPGNAYSLSGSQVVFTGAPSSSLDFHGAILGATRIIQPEMIVLNLLVSHQTHVQLSVVHMRVVVQLQ